MHSGRLQVVEAKTAAPAPGGGMPKAPQMRLRPHGKPWPSPLSGRVGHPGESFKRQVSKSPARVKLPSAMPKFAENPALSGPFQPIVSR